MNFKVLGALPKGVLLGVARLKKGTIGMGGLRITALRLSDRPMDYDVSFMMRILFF